MGLDLGDVLAVPINRTQYQALKVARLNIATRKIIGNVKIQWTDIFPSHLELGSIHGMQSTLKMFRFSLAPGASRSSNPSLSG
jgi:hypothetical protein